MVFRSCITPRRLFDGRARTATSESLRKTWDEWHSEQGLGRWRMQILHDFWKLTKKPIQEFQCSSPLLASPHYLSDSLEHWDFPYFEDKKRIAEMEQQRDMALQAKQVCFEISMNFPWSSLLPFELLVARYREEWIRLHWCTRIRWIHGGFASLSIPAVMAQEFRRLTGRILDLSSFTMAGSSVLWEGKMDWWKTDLCGLDSSCSGGSGR